MSVLKGFILAVAVMIAGALNFGCDRSPSPVPPQIVGGQQPTTQLERMGAVTMALAPPEAAVLPPPKEPAASAVPASPAVAPVKATAIPKALVTPPVKKSSGKSAKTFVGAKVQTQSTDVELLAEGHGLLNDALASCWRRAVDRKIDMDVVRGEIADWGNVLESNACEDYQWAKVDPADVITAVKAYHLRHQND